MSKAYVALKSSQTEEFTECDYHYVLLSIVLKLIDL